LSKSSLLASICVCAALFKIVSGESYDNLPVEVPPPAEVKPDAGPTVKRLKPIRQHNAQYAVATMNQEVLLDVAEGGRAPKEIELRPPEGLLKANVGTWDVPVIIYFTESDIRGTTPPTRTTYEVEVVDVDECSDTSLPTKWKHQCNGRYVTCRNTKGDYECDCIDGTSGVGSATGAKSTDEFGAACKDPVEHITHRGTCKRKFQCEPDDECDQEFSCAPEATCTETDCLRSEGFTKTPPTCKGSFSCSCRTGFEGDGHFLSESTTGCRNINECLDPRLHDCPRFSDCVDQSPTAAHDWENKYSCQCREGFKTVEHANGKIECIPTELCKLVDDANECHALATCATCSPSEEDMGHCRSSPKASVVDAQFKCMCQAHHKGDGFRVSNSGDAGCTPIDYCTDPVHKHKCNENADCVNEGHGNYRCDCVEGYEEHPGSHGQGKRGCHDRDECKENHFNSCHFGAKCTNMIPTKANSYEKYTCECKREEGWKPVGHPCNSHPRGGGYGEGGCVDETPPKAFLRCATIHTDSSTVDALFDKPMGDVFKALTKTPQLASCSPDYTPQKQLPGNQMCLCSEDQDQYKQYAQYEEKGMIVKDDNVGGSVALRERINFENLPFEHFHGIYLSRVGKYPQAVKYEVQSGRGLKDNGDVDECATSIPEQIWYREIEVVPANECEDTTLIENFRHKCHANATCTDTRERYSCECIEGYKCHNCDGYRMGWALTADATDPAQFNIMRSDRKGGPGCRDHIPPVIGLVGKWPLILPECKCGDDDFGSNSTAPSRHVLESHGLSAYAYDYYYEYDKATKTVTKTPVEVEVQWANTELFPCEDIPETYPVSLTVTGFDSDSAPNGARVQAHGGKYDHIYAISAQDRFKLCDHNPVAWKITFTATDAVGNHAEPVSHYVVEKKVEVLARLLALERKEAEFEQFVKEQERKMEREIELEKGRSEANAKRCDETARVVDDVLMKDHQYILYFGIASLVLLTIAALYFGWHSLVLKMLASVCFPHSCARNDFEEGYDLWLRLTSCGFKSRLDRVRAIERQWATMEDTHED